jgi:nucleoid-associated protein YgaU
MAGLFEFAKDIGKKLFHSSDDDAQKAQKIRQSLSTLNLPKIDVTFQDGQARLSGEALNADQKEKAVLLAGNVQGVENVDAAELQAPPQEMAVQFYVIQSGDTLSMIAKRFYGNASEYPRIFEANREVIEDPDKIYPGQKIRIPEAAPAQA